MTIGVLALQGDFEEHAQVLESLGVSPVRVTRPEQMEDLQGLVIPGGESTTMTRLIRVESLESPLRRLKDRGVPVFGTCAGVILMARRLARPDPRVLTLGFLDIVVERNAYGRQRESFEVTLEVQRIGPVPAVFIRAPRILEVGPEVEVLAEHQGDPVLVRQGPFLGATFHPEVVPTPEIHRMFLEMVESVPAG